MNNTRPIRSIATSPLELYSLVLGVAVALCDVSHVSHRLPEEQLHEHLAVFLSHLNEPPHHVLAEPHQLLQTACETSM